MGKGKVAPAYSQRQLRVGELIKQNIGEIFIRNEAKILALNTSLVTVTEVKMAPDLKSARVYVIPLGGKETKKIVSILTEFSHLVRRALSKKLAEQQHVEIKYFNIIYEVLELIEKGLSGLLEPEVKETVIGTAEILKVFKVSDAGKIAGSKVTDGEITNKAKARLIRDGAVVYTGEILSIFREKNQVKEVKNGVECGISLKDFIDFKEKDVIEAFLSENIDRQI